MANIREEYTDYSQYDDLPKGTSTRWFKCGYCDNLHVIVCIKDDEPYVEATFSPEMLKSMVEVIEGPPSRSRRNKHGKH